jgi:basic endochitinase B
MRLCTVFLLALGFTAAATTSQAAEPASGPEAYFSAEDFDRAFPPASRHKLYSYDAFLKAAATFPKFCGEGTVEQRKRELAAFLGNVAHETGSLKYAEEIKKGDYRQDNKRWPPQPGKQYYGRGPLQLTWNYNYGRAGDALGLDLLGDPDLVARDGVVAFRTSLWFWMNASGAHPSCHDVLTERWTPNEDDVRAGRLPGFGMTVVLINGGEAGKPGDARVRNRIRQFEKFAKALDVSVGDNVSCERMKNYGAR